MISIMFGNILEDSYAITLRSFIFCYMTFLAVNLTIKMYCYFMLTKLTALRYVKLAICRATWIAALIRQDMGNLIMAATLIPWCTPHINP
jgi:hypothetical protein